MVLFPEENLFKISNKKYLFKYPIWVFEKKFKNNDESIINILLKDNLNYIQIITQKESKYVFITEKFFDKKNKLEFIDTESNEILKINNKDINGINTINNENNITKTDKSFSYNEIKLLIKEIIIKFW